MVDAFSKWTEVRPLRNKSMDEVTNKIIQGWIARYGPPRQFHSDNGTEFTNKILKAITGRLGITHSFSTPLHPQSNGQVERVNKDIINYLTKYFHGNNEWESQISLFSWAHNSTATASTGLPPYTVVFGVSPRLPFIPQEQTTTYSDDYFSLFNRRLSIITDYVTHMQKLATERGEKTFNKGATDKTFDIGSRIYLTSIGGANRPQKLKFKFEGPYLIIKSLGHDMYEVKRESDGKISKTHANRIKLVIPGHAMQEIVPPTPEKEQQEGPLPRLQRILKRITITPKRTTQRHRSTTRDPDRNSQPVPGPNHGQPQTGSQTLHPARDPDPPTVTHDPEIDHRRPRDPPRRHLYNLRPRPGFHSSIWTSQVTTSPRYPQASHRPRPPEWAYSQPCWLWGGPSLMWPSW